MSPNLLVRVPDDLVSELLTLGLAEEVTDLRRSETWEVIATWLTGAGTVISLMQGPETVAWLAKAVFKRKKEEGQAVGPYLQAKGEGGEGRMLITESTSFEDVEGFLTALLFPASGRKK